ncbi:hypothetical protein QBC39DRAFT_376914 [Podospora conica]|nr:hypothetical protein QBC39DRAFT_376914 [Schizothecium conicum]
MFRRRRPVLGTALIIGASRGAARREVSKQTAAQQQQSAQNSDEVNRQVTAKQQEEEARKREQDEQEVRIQKAVEEAVRKAAPVSVGGGGEGRGSTAVYAGGEGVQEPRPAMLAPEGEAGRRGSFVGAPLVGNGPGGVEVMPAAAREVGGAVGEVLFCGKCGLRGEVGDGFCRRCGMGLRG